jgi:hypothetical protein
MRRGKSVAKCKLCNGPTGKDDPNDIKTPIGTRFKLDIPDEVAINIEEDDRICCSCMLKFLVVESGSN